MTLAARLEQAHAALDSLGASRERLAWHVPGRIEVLGKHTDYAGGRSLLCATSRGLAVVAAPRADRTVRVHGLDRRVTVSLTLDPALAVDRGGWGRYPATVARRLARDFPGLATGIDLAFDSDLPAAAGASSSSALVVACFSALAELNALAARADYRAAIPDTESLATYLGCVENGYAFGPFAADGGVGTAGGSEDHTAILFGREGRLARCSFCPVRVEGEVMLPDGLVFAVASSGVRAAKAGGAGRSGVRERFNRLSAQAARLSALWRERTGRSEATLGDITARPGGAEELAAIVASSSEGEFSRGELAARLEQFVLESEHAVPAAAAALAASDLAAFGAWVERSVEAGARALGNQIPETLALVERARALGARASSPFGGGFGGSVWALVASADVENFLESWLQGYLDAFPRHSPTATAFLTPPAEGLRRLE